MANSLPPRALIKTWFDLMTNDTTKDREDNKIIQKQARSNILSVFDTQDEAMSYFVQQGWVNRPKR